MSVNKEYRLLTQVPIGTEMVIKETSKSVKLNEIRYFPTRYKCSDGNYYYTHQVDILWDGDNIRDESNWNLDTGGEG